MSAVDSRSGRPRSGGPRPRQVRASNSEAPQPPPRFLRDGLPGWSRLRREDAHVDEHGEDVGSLPVLHDVTLVQSNVVDSSDPHGPSGGLDTEERPKMRALARA